MDPNATSPRARYLAIRVVFIAFLAGIVTLAIWSLPGGYSADLSQVGRGGNVVVQVHDHSLVSSTALMDSLNRVRGDYRGVIEFVVADMQVAAGQAFAQAHQVEAATLLLFARDGTRLGVVQGAHDPATLRGILNQVYRLPAAR